LIYHKLPVRKPFKELEVELHTDHELSEIFIFLIHSKLFIMVNRCIQQHLGVGELDCSMGVAEQLETGLFGSEYLRGRKDKHT
jgi:hypothetical protein